MPASAWLVIRLFIRSFDNVIRTDPTTAYFIIDAVGNEKRCSRCRFPP